MYAPVTVAALRAAWGAEVRVVATRAALRFVASTALAVVSGSPPVTDESDGSAAGRVPHVELARWADLIVVAPATGNMLGLVAGGLAPDAVSTLIMASGRPVLFAPSMNSAMWDSPAVKRSAQRLVDDGHYIIAPVAGPEACDRRIGTGGMVPIADLLAEALEWWRR
jgi:phosphopantothenoylcysteine decarboxylase/phosphopantothenate--cysteine ligase